MTGTEISNLRLIRQFVGDTSCKAADVVKQMGAMQAQDFSMAKWALGIRTSDSELQVEDAYNRAEIIRTHVLRPTWHFVHPDDIYWMLQLSSPSIKASMRSRNKELELTPDVFAKSRRIIEKALEKEKFLIREELNREYLEAGIRTDNNRLSHLLMEAELDAIICSGPVKNGKTTYALLAERVPFAKRLSREEALAELATRYFTSHGPAQVQDFSWWSGLSLSDARRGLDMIRSQLVSITRDQKEFLMTNDELSYNEKNGSAYFLPAYDEFLISYRDRSVSLPENMNKKIVSSNGIFYPVIVINGKVAGLWRRNPGKETTVISAELFSADGLAEVLPGNNLEKFSTFLNRKVEFILNTPSATVR